MLVAKSLSALHVRLGRLLAVALIVGLCIHLSTTYGRLVTRVGFSIDPTEGPSAEEQCLKRLADGYKLTNQTEWLAWRVQSAGGGNALGHVGLDFAPQSRTIIDVRAPDPAAVRAPRRMALPARDDVRAGQTDASDLLFGVSTSYERIADRDWALLRAWQRWLTGANKESNGAGLVLMLDKATDRQLQEVDDELSRRGLAAHLMSTEESMSMAKRYHELVRIFKTYGATLAASGQRKKWFGLVEDTVFFPGLSHLGERLSTYRADDELYIGLSSERRDRHADAEDMTTSRGGAVLLTRRAVDRIPRLPCLEASETVAPAEPKRWDAMLQECVKQRAGVDMHFIPASYSPRHGDAPQGATLEAQVRPLVLNAHQDGHRLDVGMAHLVTDVCGEACFMQRFLFRDDWVLVNGVSISQHPGGLRRRRPRFPPAQSVDDKDDVGRPLSASTGRRRVWRLLDSASATDGSVWQAYLKRGTRGGDGTDAMDSVIVLIWEQNTLRPR